MKNDTIDQFLLRKHRDYSSVESRKKVLSDTFRNNNDFYRQEKDFEIRCDADRNRIQRRTRAAENNMDKALSLYEKYCPQIDDVFYPAEDYAEIAAAPLYGYDDLEKAYDLMLGASYWILDELHRCGKIPQAILLFENDPDVDPEAVICSDVSYSYETVSGILHILKHRNDDCKGYRSRQDMKRIWMDELTARSRHHQSVPSRNRYEDLLKLIPQERKQKAVDLFRRKAEEAFVLYLKCRKGIARKQDKASMQVDRFLHRVKNNEVYQDGNKASPVMMSKEKFNRKCMNILEEYKGIQRFIDQYEDLGNEVRFLQNSMSRTLGEKADLIFNELDEESRNLLSQFQTEDPFAICFACLYLIDMDDDLPWMYFPCTSILSRAGMSLPWYGTEYDETTDLMHEWKEGDPVVQELPDLNQAAYLEKDSEDEESDYCIPVTLNQIIYELCGDRFPADTDHFGLLEKQLDQYNLNEKERLFVLTACIAMHAADHQIDYSPFFSDFLESFHQEKKTEESSQSMKEMIRDQKQELEALHATAHRLQKMYAEQCRKYQTLEKERDEDTQELAELREIFFTMNNGSEKEESSGIHLPYEVRQITTVFGGHPTWQKEIVKQLHGNIRFIDTNKGYDEHIIRNSECIWLQTNAMSHSDFYKIVNAARTHHIPFHYFQYASAMKCAQQVAEKDRG